MAQGLVSVAEHGTLYKRGIKSNTQVHSNRKEELTCSANGTVAGLITQVGS